jgi:hypothetical protein
MFGMPTLKVGGKGFAGLFGDAMVFKLQGDAHARARALADAVLFDPSGMGRAMKEWVVLPRTHAKQWPVFAREAIAYVSGATKLSKASKPAVKPTKPSKPAAKPTNIAKPAKAPKRRG